uniref:Cysteine rich tail 1 n=1 Tax=Canis lupus familiaris TaxID=9615 RepID=A0A8C0M9P9_CANLF
MRWSSRTRMPRSASPGLTCGQTWGSSWRRLPLPGSHSLYLQGPAPQSPPGSCSPLRRPQGARMPRAAKGATQTQGQQAWLQPGNPYGSGQHPAGLTYAGRPPMGRGDDIAHHCCCCPCCSCCHCPRFCRCHSCCCIVS